MKMNNIESILSKMGLDHNDFLELVANLKTIEDPRIERGKLHPLESILAIYLCATICGREGWDEVYDFATARIDYFEKLVSLPHGMPSRFTFARVIERINTKVLQEVTSSWLKKLQQQVEQKQIAIDGKVLRRSHDRKKDKEPCYLVNAWNCGSSMIIAQNKVPNKGHELAGIKSILKNIDIEGATISIDALGCQKELAKLIKKRGGDYLFALKLNQKELHDSVKIYFNNALKLNNQTTEIAHYETTEKSHGRFEKRDYYVTVPPSWINVKNEWNDLAMIGTVISQRTVDGKTSKQQRFFIASQLFEPETFAQVVRNHWSIENSLHWVLDVTFEEDACRIRRGFAPENVAWFRGLAVSLLKQEQTKKRSIRKKMLIAADDFTYLLKILLNKGCLVI
jgi:predicted transposase YbfD/YdcC